MFNKIKEFFINRKLKYQSMTDLQKLYIVFRSLDSTFFMISVFLMILVALSIYVVCRLYEVGII